MKIPGFIHSWKQTTVNPIPDGSIFMVLRNWQRLAFLALCDTTYSIINAPMGSGKSLLMCIISAYRLLKNPSLRCIISVPQTIIGSGFRRQSFKLPDGRKIDWVPQYNFCNDDEYPDEGTIQGVISFLKGPHASFNDRILLCTHATLVAVYKRLKDRNQLSLLKNLMLWIDEAHHVKNIDMDVEWAQGTYISARVSNGIGDLSAHFVDHPEMNLQLGLATASFFRGDRCTLLSKEMEPKFKRFNLPYDQYLESMDYLRSFSFSFRICNNDHSKTIKEILQTRRGKDIIYIPHPVSRHSSGCKYKAVDRIISRCQEVYGGTKTDEPNGLAVLRNGKSDYKILDLVDEDQRPEKKQFTTTINDDRNALDLIVALGMFKEGADWIWADRSIIVGPRNSLTDMIQMIGRLFRDAKGKKHVEIVVLLPFSLEHVKKKELRDNLNSYLKAVFASLLLENVLHPVKIKGPAPSEDKDGKKSGKSNESHLSFFEYVVPDETERLKIMDDVKDRLLEICVKKEQNNELGSMWEEGKEAIKEVLVQHGVKERFVDITKHIWTIFSRRTLQMQGLDVDKIDFDIIKDINPLRFLLEYTSGICGIKTFRALKLAIHRTYIDFESARRFVHTLKIKSHSKWQKWCSSKKPDDIPVSPDCVYKGKGWINWGDWFGTGLIATNFRKYRSFEEAKLFVQKLNLKSWEEWTAYAKSEKKPKDIPAKPQDIYKDQWISSGDWTGTDFIALYKRKYRPYDKAVEFVHKLGLNNIVEWKNYCKSGKKPKDIPTAPDASKVYDGKWKNWSEWLGTSTTPKNSLLPIEEAKKFVHKLGLKSRDEWNKYCESGKKPINIPKAPQNAYAEKGWKGVNDWLGNWWSKDNIGKYRSYDESRKILRQNGINTERKLREWRKKNKNNGIPSVPHKFYKNSGWKSWSHFFSISEGKSK